MNNSKIYFRITLAINILFWLNTIRNFLVFPLGGTGVIKTSDLVFNISQLSLFILAILLSFFWGGWLLFRLGFKNRSVWLGITFGLISLFLAALLYLYWTINSGGIITNPQ